MERRRVRPPAECGQLFVPEAKRDERLERVVRDEYPVLTVLRNPRISVGAPRPRPVRYAEHLAELVGHKPHPPPGQQRIDDDTRAAVLVDAKREMAVHPWHPL
jgi:hypothetical protein